MSPALSDRLALLESQHLFSGSHAADSGQMCVMEAVAFVAGESWSDHPRCACPVIAAFLRNWNDSLPTDDDRDRLLKPLVLKLVDTKSTKAVEKRRAYLAFDWVFRIYTPKWLDLNPNFAAHALALRNAEEITDQAGAVVAGNLTSAARSAAESAARSAARSAAQSAARSAAESTAESAAWSAARSAAESTAWSAARSAAESAAANHLRPTVEWLQLSALDLVARMIAVREVPK